jgi:hypothetical protein
MKNDAIALSFRAFEFSSFCMASILKAILQFLRTLHLARDYISRFRTHWVSLFTFLRRGLSLLRHFRLGRPGALPRPKSLEPSFFGSRPSGYSVSSDPTVPKECIIAASTVPESVVCPSTQERAERQRATATPTGGITTNPVNISTDHLHAPNQPTSLDGRIITNHSSGNLSAVSIQSRASDRFSVITNSHESIRDPPVGQPPRLARATYRQFGRGPDPSRSRDRPSRPPTPTSRPLTPHQHPIHSGLATNLRTPARRSGDGRVSPLPVPVVQPPVSSDTHETPNASSIDGNRRRQRTTSVVFDLQNPSTESISSPPPPQLAEEPSPMDTSTAHSSPVAASVDLHDEVPIHSTTASPWDYLLPPGRSLQAFNSDQVPRYTRNITMQVRYTITP